METATRFSLANQIEIRLVSAPLFLATKLEAFAHRGKGDILASGDLEDVVYVIDGRGTVVEDVLSGPPAVRQFIQSEIGRLLANRSFLDFLSGFLLPDPVSQARVTLVLDRLRALA